MGKLDEFLYSKLNSLKRYQTNMVLNNYYVA